MRTERVSTDAKHRFLIFLYINCLTLSLAPSVVAPPQRGFVQGQPELQQAMDNMVSHGPLIGRDFQFLSGDVEGYPALLTHKTSDLLSEAEHMLNRVKNVKERRWVEAFVHRLKVLAAVLEQSVSAKYPTMNEGPNFNVEGKPPSSNGATVSEVSHLHPTWPALPESADPGPDSEVKIGKIASKYPVTSPELSQVLPASDYPGEHQVVTKPGLVPNKSSEEDDELVRELESLHDSRMAVPENLIPHVKETATTTKSPDLTSPATPRAVNAQTVEDEKAKIKEELVQEVSQLQRLGETREEILNALNLDDFKFPDFSKPISQKVYDPNVKVEKVKKFEPAENIGDEVMQRIIDVRNNENLIARANSGLWHPEMNRNPDTAKPANQMYTNNTYQRMHLNLPTIYQQTFAKNMNNGLQANPAQNNLYMPHGSLQNTIQNLQRQKNLYLYMKNHMLHDARDHQNGQQPNALQRNQISQPDNKQQNYQSPAHFPGYLVRNGYAPKSYLQQMDDKNSTIGAPQAMMPSFPSKSFSNHNIDTELTDEMKRQLRDGKIIVLSDSLVHTKFKPNEPNTEVGSNGAAKKETSNLGDVGEKMNGTQAQN